MSVKIGLFEPDLKRFYSKKQRREIRWHMWRGHWVRYARTLGLIECMESKCRRRQRPWKWQT